MECEHLEHLGTWSTCEVSRLSPSQTVTPLISRPGWGARGGGCAGCLWARERLCHVRLAFVFNTSMFSILKAFVCAASRVVTRDAASVRRPMQVDFVRVGHSLLVAIVVCCLIVVHKLFTVVHKLFRVLQTVVRGKNRLKLMFAR